MKAIGFGLAIILVLAVGFTLGRLVKDQPSERATMADTLMTASDFDYSVLSALDSNRLVTARKLLEEGVFMDLQEIWEDGGRDKGDFNSDLTRSRFLEIYVPMRHRIELSRFAGLPAPIRLQLTNFEKEADIYVAQHVSNNK